MSIETLSDIAEELADKLALYGNCDPHDDMPAPAEYPYCCRSHFSVSVLGRIHKAARIERQLGNTEGMGE